MNEARNEYLRLDLFWSDKQVQIGEVGPTTRRHVIQIPTRRHSMYVNRYVSSRQFDRRRDCSATATSTAGAYALTQCHGNAILSLPQNQGTSSYCRGIASDTATQIDERTVPCQDRIYVQKQRENAWAARHGRM